MTEYPAIFHRTMVPPIMAGLKLKTRRVIKQQPNAVHGGTEPYWYVGGYRAWPYRKPMTALHQGGTVLRCPYGKAGDRLWVREACRAEELEGGLDVVRYRATPDEWVPIEGTRESVDQWLNMRDYRGKKSAWVPPIHMPRWACRIVLEVTGIAVERLQDITEEDAIAEGVERDGTFTMTDGSVADTYKDYSLPNTSCINARDSFKSLWCSLHGRAGWDENPWVWVVSFKRMQP